MQLRPLPVVDTISPEEFKNEFYDKNLPVIIRDLSHQWPAYTKWNWDYFKELVGDKQVPLYNNVKSDAYTPINKADDYKTFGEYIDMISQGPAAWRIFLFNIFDHAPQLINDFTWPEHMMKGFVKKYPCSLRAALLPSPTCILILTFPIFYIHSLRAEKEFYYFPLKNNINSTANLMKFYH